MLGLLLVLSCSGDDPTTEPQDSDVGSTGITDSPSTDSADSGSPETGDTQDSDTTVLCDASQAVVTATNRTDLVTETVLALELDPTCAAEVTCRASVEGILDEEHVLSLVPGTSEALLQGLLADTTYSCTLTTPEGVGEQVFSTTTGALPTALASYTLSMETWDTSNADPAWLLLNLFPRTDTLLGQFLVVVDREARFRWYLDLSAYEATMGFEWHPEERLFVVGGGLEYARLEPGLLDLSGRWQTILPVDSQHDVKWFKGVLVTLSGAREDWCVDEYELSSGTLLTKLCASHVPDVYVAGVNSLVVRDEPSGRKYYVSTLAPTTIMRLDATTMTVDWVFGRNEDFTGISIAEMPDLVHDLHLEDCPEHDVCMVFYDNGINSLQSRGMEVGLDEGSMTATVLRTWTEDGWYSSALGGIQELDDGDWVIGAASMHLEGVEANDASVVQVTEAGEVVWRMRLGPVPATLYRSRWIAGCDMFSSHTAYCDRE